jgi:hypothetical protein
MRYYFNLINLTNDKLLTRLHEVRESDIINILKFNRLELKDLGISIEAVPLAER